MQLEFDKEIDALLRGGAARVDDAAAKAGVAGSHLDADELSAFAENALPQHARALYVEHLADCARCRTMLAAFAAVSDVEHAVVADPGAQAADAAAAVPWWRRLFAVPGLAYAMGALVLIFSGFAVYLVLNGGASRETQIARTTEHEPALSMSNASTSTISTTNANSAANVAQGAPVGDLERAGIAVGAANAAEQPPSAPAEPRADADKRSVAAADTAAAPPVAAVTQAEAPKTLSVANPGEKADDDKAKRAEVQIDGAEERAAANSVVSSSQVAELPMTARNTTELKMRSAAKAGPRQQQSAAENMARQSANDAAVFRRRVEGKNFEFREGVWYDLEYRGAATTRVARGTEDFKKLPDKLRDIARKLDGVIVVMHDNRAYRIE
ncbi:MAG: zf-HC2 domain-containing protein [Pyrinomonadaceae bacterium]